MLTRNTLNTVNILIICYFIIVLAEVVSHLFVIHPAIFAAKLSGPVLLALLYKHSAAKPNPFFYVLITLLLFANILFFLNNPNYYFLAMVISILQKIVMLLFVMRFTKKKYGLAILAALPFIFTFYYLNSITDEFETVACNALFFESVLVSFMGGVALAAYLKDDNRQHSWLLISTLLFIGLQFVVFIERYYFALISFRLFHLMAIILCSFGFLAFYKFLNAAERNENPNM
jgi:hypothetical protein